MQGQRQLIGAAGGAEEDGAAMQVEEQAENLSFTRDSEEERDAAAAALTQLGRGERSPVPGPSRVGVGPGLISLDTAGTGRPAPALPAMGRTAVPPAAQPLRLPTLFRPTAVTAGWTRMRARPTLLDNLSMGILGRADQFD